MARFGAALAILLSASNVHSFHNLRPHSRSHVREKVLSRQAANEFQRGASASPSSPELPNKGVVLGDAINSVTNAVGDTIAKAVSDEPDTDEAEIALKRRMFEKRDNVYKVTLPLASTRQSQVLSMGMTLCQITKGAVIGNAELNLDTLQTMARPASAAAESQDGVQIMDESSLTKRVDGEFQGLVVSSVVEGSAAWAAGVRAGHILRSTSATLGTQLWPKSTLQGVQSAIRSRKAMSKSMQFEFQRLGEAVDNQFELTLTRPIGLELKEMEDGYVVVTGFTENAPTLVQYAVKVGDRVLAVDSSIGDKLWPVSTVEGIISSVTSRLPGQQITFRFERPATNIYSELDYSETAPKPMSVAARKPVAAAAPPAVEHEELLKRCRGVIKRYTTDEQTKDKFVSKYAVPGLVADKVLDALASAGAKVDPITLSMTMGAYLSCQQSQKAITAFEAIVGVNANGSTDDATAVIIGKENMQIVADEGAMDIYTVTALLKAHAMNGDLSSVRRVLAAISGIDDSVVEGLEVASWSGTGVDGTLKPDTRCYNIVMSAAADSKAGDGLDLALLIFDGMSEANQSIKDRMEKDLVSYNTIIHALTNAGRYEEAIELFFKMKQTRLRPDKFSYTALVKSVIADGNVGDIEELLYDMRDQGVEPDIVTCNTVIKSLCDQRKIVAAKKIVSMMESTGVAPDSMTYGLLMKGLLDGRNPSAALTLFETACSDQRTVALTENVYLYTSAISAASAIGDYERALELLSRMNAIGVKPNLKTMTALVGACLSGGKPEIAVDIYQQISNPDGYAMTQGLRAMCQSGNVEDALSIVSKFVRRSRKLSGKQLMLSYKSMIECSLAQGDYELARRVLADILAKGNIPSKAIYQTIFESMQLFPKTMRGSAPVKVPEEEAAEKYKFLLFVLDSVLQRNLPCEGPLYSTILSYGVMVGGLPKKISSLLVWARTVSDAGSKVNMIIDERESEVGCLVTTWEELFDNYDELKDGLTTPTSLPSTTVRVGSQDVPTVLRAEKESSYRPRRRQEV